jgi:lipoprotein-anchoring transpeptidase ErfK/SrfK
VIFRLFEPSGRIWGLSGQYRICGVHRLDRELAKNSSTASTTLWARRIALMAAATLLALPENASAQVFWNWGPADYQDFRPVRPPRPKIKRNPDPAEARAKTAAKPVGPLVIAISIERQRLKVYDANGLFAEAPVSTGTKSHPTPMGVFSVIQKNRHHVSNLYNASMPYMQRITWSGVAMHTGPLPGYAASHGCIRLPNEFAARLWTWTRMGTRVIVAPSEVSPKDFSHANLVAKMVPQPTVSALPTPAQMLAEAASTKPVATPRRTADARETIEGMKGTLTDVGRATPVENKATDAETKPADAKSAAAPEAAAATNAVEPKAADVSAEAEPKLPGIPGREADAKPAESAERSADKATTAASDELAVKPEDRDNNDDSETTAATPEPVQKAQEQKGQDQKDQVQKSIEKPAEPKPAVAAPAETKPAEPAQEIAKPADIMKPADRTKPADVAAPSAAPEPAKPVVTAPPRRHSHVAVFISRKDKKLYIRHGYEPVYDTPVEIADADRPLGTHVFTARGDKDDAHALRWSVVSLPVIARKIEPKRTSRQGTKAAPAPVHSNVIPTPGATEALDRIKIPDEAMEKIASIISPGGSLLISDYGLTGWETGKGTDFIVPLRQ